MSERYKTVVSLHRVIDMNDYPMLLENSHERQMSDALCQYWSLDLPGLKLIGMKDRSGYTRSALVFMTSLVIPVINM